jgi:hypothetical protein
MIDNALNEGSVALRLDFQVARAVHHHGVLQVLRVALLAWWNRPRIPRDIPARLRADMGLPPAPRSWFWPEPDDVGPLPVITWKM